MKSHTCVVCFENETDAEDLICVKCRASWTYECPLCKTEWVEKVRLQGACPRCGAGWEEMGRVAIRRKL